MNRRFFSGAALLTVIGMSGICRRRRCAKRCTPAKSFMTNGVPVATATLVKEMEKPPPI